MSVSEALGERRTARVPAARTFIPEDNPQALVDSLRRFL
jgi:hypothetical protein